MYVIKLQTELEIHNNKEYLYFRIKMKKEKPITYNSNSNSLSMSCISPNHSNYDKIQRNHKSNNKISTKKKLFQPNAFSFYSYECGRERLLTFGRKLPNSATVSFGRFEYFMWHLTGLYTPIAFGCSFRY